MLDFSKQFAIIDKLKSLTKITKSFGLKKDKNQITEEIAKKIQKNAYENVHALKEECYTPPYKQLAEQLQVKNEQIFKAAVFNLANIAINRKRYASEIIKEFEKVLEESELTPEQKQYLQSKLEQVRQSR